MSRTSKIYPYIKYSLIVAVVSILFVIFPIGNYFLFTILLILYSKRYFSNRILPSLISCGIISVAIVIILSTLLEVVAPSKSGFYIFNSIFALAAIVSASFLKYDLSFKSFRFTKKDLLVVILSAICVFFLLLPVRDITSGSAFIRFLSNGEDNASHFAIYNRAIKVGGPSYLDSYNETGLIIGLETYPQGIHQYYAYITSELLGNKVPGLLLELRLYYLLNVLLLALLAAGIMLLLAEYLAFTWLIPAGFLAVTSFMVGAGLFLIGWGFMTQIAAIMFLIFGIFAILRFSKQKNAFFIVLYISCLLGIAHSWYPILAITLVPALFQFKKIFQRVFTSLPLFVWALVCAFTALLPVLLGNYLNTKSNPLNEPGGVYVFGSVGWIVIFAPIIISLFALLRSIHIKHLASLLSTWAVSVFLMLAIMSYQTLSVGNLSYYSYKMTYAPLVLSIIILSLCFGAACRAIGQRFPRKTIAIVLFATVIPFLVILIAKPVYPRVYANNWFNHLLLPESVKEVEAAHDSKLENRNIVYAGNCSVALDYLANRWSGAVFLTESEARSRFENRIITNQPDDLRKRYLDNFIAASRYSNLQTELKVGDCLEQNEKSLLQLPLTSP